MSIGNELSRNPYSGPSVGQWLKDRQARRCGQTSTPPMTDPGLAAHLPLVHSMDTINRVPHDPRPIGPQRGDNHLITTEHNTAATPQATPPRSTNHNGNIQAGLPDTSVTGRRHRSRTPAKTSQNTHRPRTHEGAHLQQASPRPAARPSRSGQLLLSELGFTGIPEWNRTDHRQEVTGPARDPCTARWAVHQTGPARASIGGMPQREQPLRPTSPPMPRPAPHPSEPIQSGPASQHHTPPSLQV